MFGDEITNKIKSDDRVLVLKPIEGKSAKNTMGLVDNRLFTGGNTLHAVMDSGTCLWAFKYENGILPAPLKQKFTSFSRLLTYGKEYFAKRNIEIVEVID